MDQSTLRNDALQTLRCPDAALISWSEWLVSSYPRPYVHRHPDHNERTVEGEFEATVGLMKLRKEPRPVFEDIKRSSLCQQSPPRGSLRPRKGFCSYPCYNCCLTCYLILTLRLKSRYKDLGYNMSRTHVLADTMCVA